MGYVVDPLLFRLKIVKFWFVIGFSNKKFYNYLVSFQGHFINFIMNFIFESRVLNRLDLFLGSIRLIQIFNSIYVLLFIRFYFKQNLKRREKFLKKMPKKEKFYINNYRNLNKSYLKFLALISNNNLSFDMINALNYNKNDTYLLKRFNFIKLPKFNVNSNTKYLNFTRKFINKNNKFLNLKKWIKVSSLRKGSIKKFERRTRFLLSKYLKAKTEMKKYLKKKEKNWIKLW